MEAAFHRLVTKTAFRLCLVLWLFGYILVDITATMQGRSAPGIMLLANLPLLVLGVAQSLGLAWLLDRSGERHAVLKWSVIALAVVAAGAVQTMADYLWLRMLALTIFPTWQWVLSLDVQRIFTIYLLYTWTLALSVALIWSARIGDIARLNEARAAAFEAAASRAEAAALRLQLNPHFLFNTLNGIASLVVWRKTREAEEMIGRLAEFLRSSLAADPSALIPLKQELTTVRAYLHVEEARFGGRMRVSWNIDEEALAAEVPNFLLQPVIENAVKHGVAPARSTVAIEVEARFEDESLLLAVTDRDDGKGTGIRSRRSRGGAGAGLGLANTRQRLEALYGDRASLEAGPIAGGFRCEVRLPVGLSAAESAPAE